MTDKEKVSEWLADQREYHNLIDIKLDINTDLLLDEDQIYKSLWSMIQSKITGNYEVIAESN